VNTVGALAWWLTARKLRRSPTRLAVELYDKAVVPVLRRLESGRRPPVGQSIFAVGRRPEHKPSRRRRSCDLGRPRLLRVLVAVSTRLRLPSDLIAAARRPWGWFPRSVGVREAVVPVAPETS